MLARRSLPSSAPPARGTPAFVLVVKDPRPELADALLRDAVARVEAVGARVEATVTSEPALAEVVGGLVAAGAAAVIVVVADCPTLPLGALEETRGALEAGIDVVLGPSAAGAYAVLGLRGHVDALFADIPWGTPRVLGATVRAARERGLSLHFLASCFDVGTPDDLQRLARELATTPPFRPGYPHHTAAVVARICPALLDPPRDEEWKTLATRHAYENRWLRVDESVVDVGNGRLTLYGVVSSTDGVGVVPLVGEGEVLLVRQFRYVARRATWEIPTGGVHHGETIAEAAVRELREETGYSARALVPLPSFHPNKSVANEVDHLFIGEGLYLDPAKPDDTESIDAKAFPLEQAVAMVDAGEIVDAMSVVALLATARRRP